jgi:integrase/recombinase XerD
LKQGRGRAGTSYLVPKSKIPGKTRYLPLHPRTNALIHDYLDAAGHCTDDSGARCRPTRNNNIGCLEAAITADGVYKLMRACRSPSIS